MAPWWMITEKEEMIAIPHSQKTDEGRIYPKHM
jgi:hypothetical protein